jgi:hypothetical protein
MTTYYVDPDATGANDGSSQGDAWTTIQSAFDSVFNGGDICLCKGTETAGGQIDIDANSGAYNTGYIKFIGVNSSWENDGTLYTIDADGGEFHILDANGPDYVWLENIKPTNNNGSYDGLQVNTAYCDHWRFINCQFDGCGRYGVYSTYLRYSCWFKSKFLNNGSDGLRNPGSHASYYGCKFIDNTNYGMYLNTQSVLDSCVFHGNDTGAYLYGVDYVRNCVFDENSSYGANLALATAPYPIKGCRFTNHSGAGDVGLYVSGNVRAALLGCYFGNNTTDATADRYDDLGGNTFGGTDTNQGYVTPGSDWTLRSDATGRRYEYDLDGTMSAFLSAGLTPTDSGGGGTSGRQGLHAIGLGAV